jgi:hypothetical protein
VEVPANTSYLNDTGGLSTYIKGIVGVNGTVSLTLSLGANISGVDPSVVLGGDGGSIFFYLDISTTGDISPDGADVYIGVPKQLIDELGDVNTLNLEIYVKHTIIGDNVYTLNYLQESGDEYLFVVHVTDFSVFVPFYKSTTTTTSSTGGSRRTVVDETEVIVFEDEKVELTPYLPRDDVSDVVDSDDTDVSVDTDVTIVPEEVVVEPEEVSESKTPIGLLIALVILSAIFSYLVILKFNKK